MLNFLIDPNLAYLLLIAGLVMSIFALLTPGTGILEIGALFVIFLAGYGIYHLSVNYWALALLIAGIVALVFSFRGKRRYIFLAVSILLFILGSIFLFRDSTGTIILHPVFMIVTSVCVLGFLHWAGANTIKAAAQAPVHSMEDLLGMVGQAQTDIKANGTVHVDGEDWTARSDVFIPAGDDVRIVGREGLILMVTPLELEKKTDRVD